MIARMHGMHSLLSPFLPAGDTPTQLRFVWRKNSYALEPTFRAKLIPPSIMGLTMRASALFLLSAPTTFGAAVALDGDNVLLANEMHAAAHGNAKRHSVSDHVPCDAQRQLASPQAV